MPAQHKPASDILLIAFASMVIAFFIWYIAKSADVETFDLSVPIRTDNVPGYIDLVSINPDMVTVAFQYPRMHKRFIEGRKFEVLLDLSDIDKEAGVEEDNITSRTLEMSMILRDPGVPQAIIPLHINPKEVRVTVRWRLEKAVVRPVLDGAPAENFELVGPVTVAPAEVMLTGPLNAFERAQRDDEGRIIVHTSRIDLTGATEHESGQTELDPPDALQIFIADNDPHIAGDQERFATFSYEIAEKTGQRTFAAVPVGRVSLSETVEPKIDPSHVEVVVTAPVTLLAQIQVEHIVVQAENPLGADVTSFNSRVAVEAIWSPDAPEAVKRRATLSEPAPKMVTVELSPIVEK